MQAAARPYGWPDRGPCLWFWSQSETLSHRSSRVLISGANHTEETIRVGVWSGGEVEEIVWRALRPAVGGTAIMSERDTPQFIDLNRLSALVAKRAEESSRRSIKRVHSSQRGVVTDQNCVPHGTKIRGSLSNPPGRVQRPIDGKVFDERAI